MTPVLVSACDSMSLSTKSTRVAAVNAVSGDDNTSSAPAAAAIRHIPKGVVEVPGVGEAVQPKSHQQ